jgi:hypothetical protein
MSIDADRSRLIERLARCRPPQRRASKEAAPRPSDAPIGAVGCVCSVFDRLVEWGNQVLVLERRPERVPERSNVRLRTVPEDLFACEWVLCPASVL